MKSVLRESMITSMLPAPRARVVSAQTARHTAGLSVAYHLNGFREPRGGRELFKASLPLRDRHCGRRRDLSNAGFFILAIALSACERTTPSSPLLRSPAAPVTRAAPVADAAMGSLSDVALQIAAGLQNPEVRAAVMAKMQDSSSMGFGLDLKDCDGANSVAYF